MLCLLIENADDVQIYLSKPVGLTDGNIELEVKYNIRMVKLCLFRFTFEKEGLCKRSSIF